MALSANDYNTMVSKAEIDLSMGIDNQLKPQEAVYKNINDARALYEQQMNDLIRIRTNYEAKITAMSEALYRLPGDVIEVLAPAIAKLPDAVKERIKKAEPFTLKDFVPSLYDLEHRDRKSQASQIFVLNKFVDAWEDVRMNNERKARECLSELSQKNS